MLLRPIACLLLTVGMSLVVSGQTAHVAGDSVSPLPSGFQRFDFGLQAVQIRTNCVGTRATRCVIPSFALGPSGTWNAKRFLAIDASFVVTPSSGSGYTAGYGGRISEILAGARLEARAQHYGYFIGAQPGYLRWSKIVTGVYYPTPYSYAFDYGSETHFISDVGAGMEYSPTSRIHIRGGLTDLIYRYSRQSWINYFQPSITVSYGLGKSIPWNPPLYDSARHPFLTPLNGVLLAGSALAISADAITTQRFIAHGQREEDPLARPLVKYGWSGQIAASSLELTGETFAVYGLHRIGHRWLERFLPIGVASTHAVLAYNNTKVSDKSH